MAATMKVPTEFTAVDKFTSVINKMISGVSGFTKSTASAVDRVNTKINKAFNSLNAISQLALGVGVAGLFTMAIQGVTDYEVALQSLSAVTGQETSKFTGQIEDLAKKQKKSVTDIAKGFEIVGSAMSQYLEDPEALYKINDAGILLAKAAKMDVEPALESLTSAMNQFNLGAESAVDTVNRLTAGEIVGSVSTAKATEQLSKFGAVANSINVTLPESVALIQTLGKKFTGSMQSEIGNAAKNLLLIMDTASASSKEAQTLLKKNGVSLQKLGNDTLPLGVRLKELAKIQNDSTAMAKVFGKDNAVAGAVIFDQLDTYTKWEEEIRNTNKAQEQADKNANTLINSIAELKNTFTNYFATNDKANEGLQTMKKVLKWVAEHIDVIVKVSIKLIAAFIVMKAIVWGTVAATWAYNVAIGIAGGLTGKANIAIGQSTIAMNAYKATTWLVTAAQWAWNSAMTANPIGLIIVGIAALIALIVVVIKKWDEWGAAIALIMGPIGWVISLIQSFRRNWDMIVNAFKTDGIIGGLKAIGATILDAVLQPLQQLLMLIAKIPGMGSILAPAIVGLQELREGLGVNLEGNNPVKKLDSPEQANAKMMQENRISGGVNVNIKDKNNNVESANSFGNFAMPVNLTSTQGAF